MLMIGPRSFMRTKYLSPWTLPSLSDHTESCESRAWVAAVEAFYCKPVLPARPQLRSSTVNLSGTHPEASDHKWHDDITLLVREFLGYGEQHQHVVAVRHAQCVQVAYHVGACDLALGSELKVTV